MKSVLYTVALLTVLLTLRAGAASAPLFADEVVAQGKGFEIKRSQLDEMVVGFKANAAARGEPVGLPPEEIDRRLLEKLITLEVLKTRATAEDRSKASNAADRVYAQIRSNAVTAAAFERQLKAIGSTVDKFRQQIFDQAVGEAVVEREVMSKIPITTEQAKKFYDENSKQFLSPELTRAAHVAILTRDQNTRAEIPPKAKLEKRAVAERVRERARAGEDFVKLVQEFSDDIGSRDRGGEYTFVKGQMAPEFEAACQVLAPGQLSDIVTTDYGYHVIKLIERVPARPLEFARVEERIKQALRNVEMEKQMPAFLDSARKDAGVKVLLPAGN